MLNFALPHTSTIFPHLGHFFCPLDFTPNAFNSFIMTSVGITSFFLA